MGSSLSERIAAKQMIKKASDKSVNKAAFLALKKDIDVALADGWSIKLVWETLVEDKWLKPIVATGIIQSESGLYTHILTHQRIQTKFWHISLNPEVSLLLPPDLQFYSLEEVHQLPKSTLVNNFLKEYFF